jgi:ABC-type Fe3+ transport system substrate-binding protein
VAIVLGLALALLGACQPTPSAGPSPARPDPGNSPAAGAPAAPQSAAAPANGQQVWESLQAAAKREGRLSLHSSPTTETRQGITDAFRRRFGIDIEWNASRPNEATAKLLTEKASGTPPSFDVVLTGMIPDLYENGLLADLKALWVLPEVTDATAWTLDERERYLDPEGRRMLRLFNGHLPVLAVNREHVDPRGIRALRDVLGPEYRGKIAGEDPTVSGSGGNTGAYLYLHMGEEFVRKLYTEQLTPTRDARQLADWLARGQYPIALGLNVAQLDNLLKDGFPIEIMRTLPDAPGTTSAGYGVLYVMEGAQNPSAARLFANWLASREGLEVFSRAERYSGTRKDINYAEWVPQYGIPEPGVPYMDTYNWEFKTRLQPESQAKVRDMLAAR